MNSVTMTITTPDGDFTAYVARPAQGTHSAPAIVVCQEIFGINADLRATCDELAVQGFIAVCPDLFWRLEPGLDLSPDTDWPRALALYQAYDLDTGVDDIAATLEAARRLPGASGKVGLMGFCLGGLMTYLTAARSRVDAAVSYYGGRTEEFLGEAATLASPLLMHLGEEDEFIPKPAQQRIVDALAGRPNVEVYRYPGCMHAFARHGGTHYDAAAARLAHLRTFDFFQARLQT
ncbi:dienelactone hydrolase family protein [Variovorax sp. ZT4R33]|uniref:dienelactone hydrolase family protein n=1 Tax=Variovorax sp. ZT4R33 TaxID=3443743 RepID=UPI003F46D4EA